MVKYFLRLHPTVLLNSAILSMDHLFGFASACPFFAFALNCAEFARILWHYSQQLHNFIYQSLPTHWKDLNFGDAYFTFITATCADLPTSRTWTKILYFASRAVQNSTTCGQLFPALSRESGFTILRNLLNFANLFRKICWLKVFLRSTPVEIKISFGIHRIEHL